MKKLQYIVLLAVVCLALMGFDDMGEKQRVFDSCELLMSSEVEDAEEVLKKQSVQDKADYVFVSTEDLEGYNAKEYVNAFASSKQLGYEQTKKDAVILLVDLQNNQVLVSPQGTLQEKFEEGDIVSIMSDVLPYVQKNEFLSAIEVFAHDVHSKLEAKKAGSTASSTSTLTSEELYDDEENADIEEKEHDEGGLFSNPLTCLLIGAVLAGIVVFTMILSGKSSMQAGADTYTSEARVNPYTKQDIFIRTVTKKTKKEKPKEK